MTLKMNYILSKINQLHYYLTFCLVFLLPFHKRLILIVLFLWITTGLFSIKRQSFSKISIYVLILPIFYLLHIISVFWSDNLNAAFFDLEVKLSLFIVPFIVWFNKDKYQQTSQQIIKFYFLGCLLSAIFLFSRAFYFYSSGGVFYSYSLFSYFHHAGYVSMYYCFAVGILIYYLLVDYSKKRLFNQIYLILASIVLLLAISQLSSKAGELSLILLLIFSFFYVFIYRKRFRYISLLILLTALIYSFYTLKIKETSRFSGVKQTIVSAKSIKPESNESNAIRILVWEASLSVFSNNVVCGTGIGDVKDKLIEEYSKRNMLSAVSYKYNAHNQFLETAVGLGLIGLLYLFAVFLLLLKKAFFDGSYLTFLFVGLVVFNFFVESMLNTQAGLVFFVIFYSIFAILKFKNNDTFFAS